MNATSSCAALKLWLLFAITLQGCAHGRSDSGPPETVFLSPRSWTTTGGGPLIYRTGFFSEAQMADRGWEDVQLRSALENFNICPRGHRIMTRDVRWYRSERSGRRCAAIVFTIQCIGSEPTVPNHGETTRLNDLRMEDRPPDVEGCGNKDADRRPPPGPQAAAERRLAENPPPVLAPVAPCPSRFVGTGPIRPTPRSRIRFESIIDPAADILAPLNSLTRLGSNPQSRMRGHVLSAFFVQRRPHPIVRMLDDGADNADDIVVREEFALLSGGGYCIRLTATQGRRRWSQRLARSAFPHRSALAIYDEEGGARNPTEFWSPDTDAAMLMRRLSRHLADNSSIDAAPLEPFDIESKPVNREFPRAPRPPRP